MRKLIIGLLLLPVFILPVYATDADIPTAPPIAQAYMPYEDQSFFQGFMYILSAAIRSFMPDLAQGIRTGLLLVAVTLAMSFISGLNGTTKAMTELIAILLSATVLLSSTHSLIRLSTETIVEMDNYGKLLLPVMTTALASGGGINTSASLYAGTALFSSILTSAISKLFIPMLYVFIALCIADRSLGDEIISSIKRFVKWLMTWLLKIILYVFTGFIAITGVVGGSADAMQIKATKITLSGMIPVVGGIISDASEAILVGAGVLKNAAGIYGIFAFIAICIGPILKITAHCLILKISAALCGLFGTKGFSALAEDFSQAMSLALAATGSVCLLLLISTVAFMKGIT